MSEPAPLPASRIWCAACRAISPIVSRDLSELSERFCEQLAGDNLTCRKCGVTIATVYAERDASAGEGADA